MSSESIEVSNRWALPRGLIILLGVAAALAAAVGMRQFANILGPVFMALVLSIAVHPVRRLADRYHVPGWLGVLFALLAVYGIVFGLFAILVIGGIQFASLLQDYAPQFQAFLRDAAQVLESVGISQQRLQDFVNELSPSRLVGVASSLLGGLAGVLSNIFFLIALLFFTVADAGDFARKLALLPVHGKRLADAFDRFARGSRQYLVVATIFGAIVAVCDVIALWILDIRYAWLWGLLAFITNYIPNIGFIIGLVPPTIIALLDKDVVTAIIVVLVYSVLNFVIQTIIQPRVVGVTVGLSATLSFLSLIIWATILGASGAFLAIPLSLLVKAVLIDSDPDKAWLGPLLSSEKPGKEPEPVQSKESDAVKPTLERDAKAPGA
ncbi:MAG TPA: AI-2E family transporter [Propionibacteriaceae bacterium]|jgi:AI-2 transport protein TqsA|nr:AI-2E family transporter [Propionibacteriaceae bacterium]